MAKQMKPTVILWELNGVALVIERDTGVFYTNQVGGAYCLHPEIQGVLAPLPNGTTDAATSLCGRLSRIFAGYPELNGPRAEEIDAILGASPSTAFIRVDRARLSDSVEAWVYVEIETPDDHSIFHHGKIDPSIQTAVHVLGLGRCKGILTWPNSD